MHEHNTQRQNLTTARQFTSHFKENINLISEKETFPYHNSQQHEHTLVEQFSCF